MSRQRELRETRRGKKGRSLGREVDPSPGASCAVRRKNARGVCARARRRWRLSSYPPNRQRLSWFIVYPHRIRLRGPWDCEPLTSVNGTVPPLSRVLMPCRWHETSLPNFTGRVRYRRRFGYPGRIDDVERVWLTFAGANDCADVTLNGVALGCCDKPSEPFEFEITRLLQARNEVVVEIAGTAPSAGLWGEVALEIRRTAFLRGMVFDANITEDTVQLTARGEVVGSADGLLELYLLLDRSTKAYKTVTAPGDATAFAIVSEAIPLAQWRSLSPAPVLLDLVQGAVVWYRVQQTLTTDNG